jgi:actin-related protein
MQAMLNQGGASTNENFVAPSKAEVEPMDLADCIVKSILSCPKEMHSKYASNIILAGGVNLTPHIIT